MRYEDWKAACAKASAELHVVTKKLDDETLKIDEAKKSATDRYTKYVIDNHPSYHVDDPTFKFKFADSLAVTRQHAEELSKLDRAKKEIEDRYLGDRIALCDRVYSIRAIVDRTYLLGPFIDKHGQDGEIHDMEAHIRGGGPRYHGGKIWLSVVSVNIDSAESLNFMTPEMIRRVAIVREIIDDYVAGKRDDLPQKEPWL